MSPIANTPRSQQSTSRSTQFTPTNRPRLLHATPNPNHPDEPVELAFVVMDNGKERIIKVENIYSEELFYQTQEGQQWLQQQEQMASREASRQQRVA